ncbi:ankyrin repeat-containing domain protein [Mycena polygramma]|nr:ankyrin repeat-containing domain protein [Mycena polygramma]
MAQFSELPVELVLHIVSFLTGPRRGLPDLPDLRSINALCQTNTVLHQTLDQTLYDLCASVKLLAKLAIVYVVQHQLDSTLERLVALGIGLDMDLPFEADWCSILHVAAGKGLEDLVTNLLGRYGEEMAIRAYSRSFYNATPLEFAARNEHMEIVILLAAIPPPVAAQGYSSSNMALASPAAETRQYLSLALTQSAVAGNVEICKYLISKGADVNFFEGLQFGVAHPIYYASNLATVQLLLASGADPNIHNAEFIPLFRAAGTLNLEIIQVLLDGGADINARGARSENVLALCGTVELLRFFLERGADPNAAAQGGEPLLHRACGHDDAEFAKASVELLLQFGAGPVDKLDVKGRSPVGIATARGFAEIVNILEPLVQNPGTKMKVTL